MTTENSNNEVAEANSFNSHRVVRRLAAAEGYLEIGLPTYALVELGRVNDPGPFEPIVQLFRGEALQAQEKFADAIAPLNRAAELFPSPFNQRALMALSNCYRHEGLDRLADEAIAAALPGIVSLGSIPQNVITSIFHIGSPDQIRSSRSND